jgi:hypothetical protein
MNKFEFTDLNRFLVSFGLTLLFGSAALVWLFFREPFDLNVTAEQLNKVTPLAKQIILDRQQWVGFTLKVLPLISIVVAILGLILLVYGLYRWIPYQRDYEILNRTNRQIAELQYRQMSESEVVEKARSEVLTQQAGVVGSNALMNEATSVDEAVADYLDTENALLNMLAERLPPNYELLPHQRFGMFEFDALLRPSSPGDPAFTIEIRKLLPGTNSRHVAEAMRRLAEGTGWFNLSQKKVNIPLFIAVASDLDPSLVEEANRFITTTTANPTPFGRLLVRLIAPARLKRLSAKDVKELLDTSQRFRLFSDDEAVSQNATKPSIEPLPK